jgi:hypothetical protein
MFVMVSGAAHGVALSLERAVLIRAATAFLGPALAASA